MKKIRSHCMVRGQQLNYTQASLSALQLLVLVPRVGLGVGLLVVFCSIDIVDAANSCSIDSGSKLCNSQCGPTLCVQLLRVCERIQQQLCNSNRTSSSCGVQCSAKLPIHCQRVRTERKQNLDYLCVALCCIQTISSRHSRCSRHQKQLRAVHSRAGHIANQQLPSPAIQHSEAAAGWSGAAGWSECLQ